MIKKTSASFLAWAVVWSSVSPAFAQGNLQARPGAGARAVPGAMTMPAAIPTLPMSAVIPTGINTGITAGVADDALRAAAQPGAALATPAAAAASLQNKTAAAQAAAPVVGAPAAAATPIVDAAEQAAAAEQPGVAKTLVSRIANAIVNRIPWGRVFDSSKVSNTAVAASAPAGVAAIRPLPTPTLPQGVDLDLGNAPVTPKPKSVGGIELNAFDMPGAKNAGGVFDAGPRILNADANSEADVERALREMVDADAAKYGVTSAELKTVHVRKAGSTIFAVFHQTRQSKNPDGSVQAVEIHGSQLSLTVKVIQGKAQLMSAMAQLYPSINVATNATLSDAELKGRAEQKLPQNAGIELSFVERKIIYHDNKWKTVNLYDIEGLPQAVGIKVAVDVNTGEVFAWDARLGLTEGSTPSADPQAPEAAATGRATGRGEANDHRPGDDQWTLVELPLPHLNATVAGKAGVTDADGKWSATISGNSGDFKATLSGKWAKVNDQSRKPVQISASVKPGDNVVVANPTASDESTVNQINMYVWITRIHDWWSSRLNGDKRIDKQIPVNVNIDDECNAYYTPGRPSLNFFKSSRNCSDTGRPGVGAHEYGHFVDDMIGGIVNGGMSEGWGDIGSMFLLGTPIIGEGFLKKRNPSWIRHGENTYQYSDNDEVHDQGQAWMGFAWKLRTALVAKYGEALGTQKVEQYIIPTLFAKASDIPSQMAQVLLHSMDENGKIVDEKEIRAAAKAHGIDLPKNPSVISSLWAGLTGWMGGGVSVEDAGSASVGTLGLELVDARDAVASGTTKRLTVKAGKAKAAEFKKAVESALQYRSGEHAELEYRVVESKGVTGTTLEIVLSGDQKAVAYAAEQIKRLAR